MERIEVLGASELVTKLLGEYTWEMYLPTIAII